MTTETATPNQADASTAFLRAARAGQIDKILALLSQEVDINISNANGLNAIHLAAKDGHASVVNELIARGASIDAATNKGNTALHIASLAGQEQVVKLLVQHGAQVNIQSQNGFTPLYMAAQENHHSVVNFLLLNGANQTLATEDGFTPLAVAMQQGHERVVSVLLEADSRGRVRLPALHIAAKKDDVKAATLLLENEHNPDVTSKSGFTPLHIAAHYGNEAVARLLLARGADVNCTAKHNICPLHVAAKWGKEQMVCLLCDRGAIVEARTRDGLTPLHCAARSGHERVVDALLERGAPIAGRSKNGLAPLHMAAQGDHAEAARALLIRRAPVDDLTVDYLTALHVAAHCGHVKVAKLLLDRNADANARALNGFTPLHIACKKNRMKVVELLLKYGAFISATTESGLTPLHVAAFMGCMGIVIYLLQHDAAPDAPTVRGETPLHLAARANQTDIIRILLRNGACVEARAREQHTPLHIGARLGNADIAALLLQHGAKAETQTADGYNALHIAAKQHSHDVAAVLLEHGAPVTATTKKGFTPLHLAAKYGNLKVANLLLQHGAPADVSGKNGVTPLHVAAQYDQQAVAGALLERGADAKAAAKNGHTPLHIAARKNQMETAGTLLEHGADPAAQSRAGFQPLHLAAQQGYFEMCSLLLEAGAESGVQARNGLSPLHLAAQEDRATVAKLLLQSKAKVDARTKGGYTPLHVASHFGQVAAARELLDRDADVNAKTEYGYTALHHAAQQGHINIVNLLLDHHAKPNETTHSGQTALDIASRLGYVTVLQRLKEAGGDTTAVTPNAERYKVVAPETMHETFMSDSEEEGGEDTMLTEQPYRYLTADDMKSLGDDSLPIDVTRDERADSAIGPNTIMEMSQGSTGLGFPPEDIVVKNVNHLYSAEQPTEGYCYNVDTALPNFMVSFLVDARGGAMRGCRGGGVRVVVPPLSAQQPTRITCRYLKVSRVNQMPPLMEGEALASRVLEMAPVSAKFLGPVIIEVPHYASLRGGERELVILRSDNGCNWREHAADTTGDMAHQILNDSLHIEDGSTMEEVTNGALTRTTRILTHDFPQYFAVISRIRQEVHAIGPEGGMVSSSVVPQVQAVFPQGALTKKIKVGLQAQTIETELTAKLLGRGVAVSPVVTVEPRRRKFHKAITLSMPAPRAHSHGMINNYAGSAPTLRLLCSISGVFRKRSLEGGTNRAHWEDVTENTPLTFVGECVSFTTTVSARYWLIDCRHVADAAKMATDLYREAIHVPFIARFVVYARAKDARHAELRAFCVTDDREDKTLERLERFKQVAKSRDVEVYECKSVYIELCGNLSCVSGGGGERPALAFRAFRENRLSLAAIRRNADDDAVARCRFVRDSKPPANGEPAPPPVCVLNIVIPELAGDDSEHDESTASVEDVAWKQKLSDPGLWEICRLLGRDWVPLAYELGLSAATVNQIQSTRGDATKHAALMLKLWRTQSGSKAQDNQLELALCRIGRDNIMLPSSERETERRIQRNVYQERLTEEDFSKAADKTDTNRLSAATDEMESIIETSLGADEAKYSPEEKAIYDDRTPSPTDPDGSDDEGYERSVAERKQQIERKLSTTRVPSSKQKREIREEISEIKRHSKAPEIVKLHESVATDTTPHTVIQQLSIDRISMKEELEDKVNINMTQIINKDTYFQKDEPTPTEPAKFKKIDASAQKQTPKHLQKHARQDSMIRFSSGDFSDIKITPKKVQTAEVSDVQQFLEKESEISSVTSDATGPKEIVTSVIIEKHDIEESSEGDKSPELVGEEAVRDIAEASLHEKISTFEHKMQHSFNGDSTVTQTQVKLTKEALKKHTQDYEQTVEYTQEFIRDQSRQSVGNTESVKESLESATDVTKKEEVVDSIKSVKEKIQRFDSRAQQESVSQEEKSGKFAKAMRTDSTIVQVSSEEDTEFMKKSTDSETETESLATVRIDESVVKCAVPVSIQNGLTDHKITLKNVQDDMSADISSELSQDTKQQITSILEDYTDKEIERKLAEETLQSHSRVRSEHSVESHPLDFSVGVCVEPHHSQDLHELELADTLSDVHRSTDQDVRFTMQSKNYTKDSKRGQSDSDEVSQFSESEEVHWSVPIVESSSSTSTNIRSQTSYFLELESQYSAQINAPKMEEQKVASEESPVISAKARQFIETVPEEDSVQECFFSKRIYSDSLEDSEHTDSRRHSEADSLKSDQSDLKLKISSDFDERAEYEEIVDSGSGFGDEKFDESVGFTSMNIDAVEYSAVGNTDISKGTEESSSGQDIVSEIVESNEIFKKVGTPKRHSRTESVCNTKFASKEFHEKNSKATETLSQKVQDLQIIVTKADDSIIDDRVSSFEKDDISDKISSESSREMEIRSFEGITSEDAVTDKKTSSEEKILKFEGETYSPATVSLDKQRESTVSPVIFIHDAVKDIKKMDLKIQNLKDDLAIKAAGQTEVPLGDEKRHSVTSGGSAGGIYPQEKRPSDAASLTESRDYTFDESEDSFGYDPSHDVKGKAKAIIEPLLEQAVQAATPRLLHGDSLDDVEAFPEDHPPTKILPHIREIDQPLVKEAAEKGIQEYTFLPGEIKSPAAAAIRALKMTEKQESIPSDLTVSTSISLDTPEAQAGYETFKGSKETASIQEDVHADRQEIEKFGEAQKVIEPGNFQKSTQSFIDETRDFETIKDINVFKSCEDVLSLDSDLAKNIVTENRTVISEKTCVSGNLGNEEEFIIVGPIVEIKIDEAPDIVRGESLDEFTPQTESKISETISKDIKIDITKAVSEPIQKTISEAKVSEKELDLETEILIQELMNTGYVSNVKQKKDNSLSFKSRFNDNAKLDKDILDTEISIDETEDHALETVDPKISKETVSVDSIIEEAVTKVEEYLDAGKEVSNRDLLMEHPTDFSKYIPNEGLNKEESKTIPERTFSVQSSPDDVEEKIYTDSESDMDKAKVLEIIEPSSNAELPVQFSSFDTNKIRTDSLDDAEELFQEREVEFLPQRVAQVTKKLPTTSIEHCHDLAQTFQESGHSKVSFARVIPPTIGIIRADPDVSEISEEFGIAIKKSPLLEKRTSSEVSKSTESMATVILVSAKSFEEDTKSILVEEESHNTKFFGQIKKLEDVSEPRDTMREDMIQKSETTQKSKVTFGKLPSTSSTEGTEGYKEESDIVKEERETLAITSTVTKTNVVDTIQQPSVQTTQIIKNNLKEMSKTEYSVDNKLLHSEIITEGSQSNKISDKNVNDVKETTEQVEKLATKVVDEPTVDDSKDKVYSVTIVSDKLLSECELPSHVAVSHQALLDDTKVKVDVQSESYGEEKPQTKSTISAEESPEDNRDNILEDMKDLNRLDRRCSDLLDGMSQQQGALVRIDTSYVIHDLSLKLSKTPPPSPVDLVAREKSSGKPSGLQPKGPDSTTYLDTLVTHSSSKNTSGAPSSAGDSLVSDTDALQSELLTEASKALTAAASPKSPTRHLADHLSFINVDRPTVTSGAIELVDRTIAKSIDVIDQIKMEQLAAKREKDMLLAEKVHEESIRNLAKKEHEEFVEKEEQLELTAKTEWLESGARAKQLELETKLAMDKLAAVSENEYDRNNLLDEMKISKKIDKLDESKIASKPANNFEINLKTGHSTSTEDFKEGKKEHQIQLGDDKDVRKSEDQFNSYLPTLEDQVKKIKYISNVDDAKHETPKDTFESVVTVRQVIQSKVAESTQSTEKSLTGIDQVKIISDISELSDLKFEKIGKEFPFPCIQHHTPDDFSTILTHKEIETHKISGQQFFSETKLVSSSDDDSLITKTETKYEVRGQEEQIKEKTIMRKEGDDTKLKTNKLQKAQEVTATRSDTETKAAFKGSNERDVIVVEREFQQQGLYSGRQTKSEEKMTALKNDLVTKSNEVKYSERDLSHEQWGKEYFEESELDDLKEDDEDKSDQREAYIESIIKVTEKDEATYSEEVSEKGKIVSSNTNYSKEESFLESKERDDLSSDVSHETSFRSESVEKQDSMEKSDMSPKSRSKSFKKDSEVYEVGFITEIKVSSSPGKRMSRAGSQDTQSESELTAESPVPPQDTNDNMTEKHSPIRQSQEQLQDHVWEASVQKPDSFEVALEFDHEIDQSFQIKSSMSKSTDSSDTLIESKDFASKISDFGDLKIRLSEASSAVEETGYRDIHSEDFDTSRDIMIKSAESMETEYMVKSLESHEGEALQKSMDSVSAEALHASEFSDSALHTTFTDNKRDEIGRIFKEKSLEDICSSGYDTDLSSAEFHAAKLESDRGESDTTRTPQQLADLSVLEKTIDEVKQSLEAAQGEIISEKSDGSSKYKQSPSEFEFKLISPDKPAVITEEPTQIEESAKVSEAFKNEVLKIKKAEKNAMTSSIDDITLSEDKDTIMEKERRSYDSSEPSIKSDSGPHSILETETEIVLSDIEDSSKGSPEVKLRPGTHVRSRLFAGDRRSASEVEGWSSSGESHYQSFERTESQHSSRPLSSDVENITTGQSTDYETAQMTQDMSSRSLKTSKDFYSAASSLTSRDSMRSLDSDGSSHLASIDISDASETLVPSANELKEELIESGTFSEQFFQDDARRKSILVLEESLELELLRQPSNEPSDEEQNEDEEYKLVESSSAESIGKMKRSHEMRFQPNESIPEKFPSESLSESIDIDDVANIRNRITEEKSIVEPIVEMFADDKVNTTSESIDVITKMTLDYSEIAVTECEFIKTSVNEDNAIKLTRDFVPKREEKILADLTHKVLPKAFQENIELEQTNHSIDVDKKTVSAYLIDSKQSSSSSLKVQDPEHVSAPHTPLSIPSQSSESTDNGREYVLDDMYETSETPELYHKDKTITDSKSELSVTTEEPTLFEASGYEKDQDSPTSDEFEMVDKPSEMDDFVVIEEVAREAQETDVEGKSLHIAQVKHEKKHDEEVEEYLSKTSKKQDSEYSTSGSLSEEEMASYELEQKRLKAAELAEIEAGKKWIQMQFEGDARYEYERVPLEDIKEEEMTDFDASRMGSLSSQKESIGSYGSFKNSFGSLSESEMGSRRRFMLKGEQDDISISSLQEFENLEQALMEQYQQHSSSSQDSLNGSLPRRYLLSKNGQGDDISISSLKEFEGLEKECIEALKVEIEAKQKEALLLSQDVKELSSGFLESERRSYSGGSSEGSPPQKSGSPGQKSVSPSSGKSSSPGQKSPAQKYGSPSQKALVESALMKKLIDQQMALDAKIDQTKRTPVKTGPTIITVQKKKFDDRGAFFTSETKTHETECEEPDCVKQTSYECTDTKEQHRISDESLAGDCEEMMKILEKQEVEKQHTDLKTTETMEVVTTEKVTQLKYIDGNLISGNVMTSSYSPIGMDIPGARVHEEIVPSGSYKSLEMESSRSLTSEMSTSVTSQVSDMDSIVTLLEQPYSLESADSSSTSRTTITTIARRPTSMEIEKPEHLDLGSSDSELIIKEVLSPMSGRSSQTVISTSGKQFTDPASGSWSGQEEDMSSSGSFSRGARCELMLGSMDSLEASSSNATRATYNYEVDTPMTGSLTSGGSNTMVSSLDTLEPVTTLYGEASAQVEGYSHSERANSQSDNHMQDSDTERQETDSQAPRAKERTMMFDSTDTLSGASAVDAGREVDAVATFYIGDTPIVRGGEGRYEADVSEEPSCIILSGSAPASLPTLPVTPPVPAQRRSLTATSLAKSAMAEEYSPRKD